MEELMTCEGTVHSIIFQNAENGYTVLRLLTEEGEVVTVVGCIPCVAPGEHLAVSGVWEQHPQHGEQLRAVELERTLPEDEEEIFSYLSSGICKGVGPATARRIVDRFGAETLTVLEREPERLSLIKGITAKKAQEIAASFRQHMGLRRLMAFLAQYQLPPVLAMQLRQQYGDAALEMVENNPYLLSSDSCGVEFSVTDEIAMSMGIAADSMERLQAAVTFELSHNENNGHVFLPRNKLVAATCQLLDSESSLVEQALDDLIDRRAVVQEQVVNVEACYLRRMWEAEVSACVRLNSLLAVDADESRQAERTVAEIEREQGITYAAQQRQAVALAAQEGVLILTGGPGTGKTTTIRGILSVFEQMGLSVALAAPTGRAAKRMTALSGAPAKTIHRLLEAGFTPDHTRAVFARNEDNPIDADAVIVDELSMVDLPLMYALLSAVRPGTKLVLVGDADQLPSVGPGNLLRDILASAALPMVQLHEIFRQAQQSRIVSSAHCINVGIAPVVSPEEPDSDFFFMKRSRPEDVVRLVTELCRTRLPGYRGLSPADIQVIAPTKQRLCGTVSLNQYLQAALNPKKNGDREMRNAVCALRVGDRVMQIVNDYELPWQRDDGSEAGLGVFNGDIGVVETVDERAGLLTVRYDDRLASYSSEQLGELELAYAVTVHKAQGSEFPCVIFVAFDGPERLLTRNLLYTGFTRAKNLLVIVGRP
ncbi:MAG: ATP-dependent RecD-like DNA helicase, partial [Dysosmobacter sp.]|nr:ATP-dependent RecD-like DNA helicase [Dysosmobacter sp.]